MLDVIQSTFERIGQLESRILAWAHLDQDLAFASAKKIDSEIEQGCFRGTLYGVPVGIKDIFNTIDMPTAMGSPLWKDFTPGNDARVVHYLRIEGAVFPGKTVTAEFAVHEPGPTRNPVNLGYSPGTSSSGSAASVACSMIPCSLGTQTAGSIIRPASYCGCWGFKPSFGVVPRTGVLKTVDTLDTVGMFARDPKDLRMLFEVIRVRGHNFPVIEGALDNPDRQNKKKDRAWRIAVIPDFVYKYSQPFAKEAFWQFISTLERHAEIEISEHILAPEFYDAHSVHETIYTKSLSYYFQREFGQSAAISRIVRQMIENGRATSIEDYHKAIDRQRALYQRFDDLMKGIDVLLILSTQGFAPRFGMDDLPDTCLIWTLCGAAVVGAPVFISSEGMPFGLQIVARRYNDYLLLNFCDFLAENFRPFAGEIY